jgi:hypothetical protein
MAGYAKLSPSKVRSIGRSAMAKSLRGRSPNGTAPISKRSSTKIMTKLGKASQPRFGYASTLPASVVHHSGYSPGGRAKGVLARARSKPLGSGGVNVGPNPSPIHTAAANAFTKRRTPKSYAIGMLSGTKVSSMVGGKAPKPAAKFSGGVGK